MRIARTVQAVAKPSFNEWAQYRQKELIKTKGYNDSREDKSNDQ